MMNDKVKSKVGSGEGGADGTRGPEAVERAVGAPRSQSFARIAYRQLVRNRLAMVGFVMIFIVATIAVYVPFLANDKPLVIHCTLPDEYEEAYYSSRVLSKIEGVRGVLGIARVGDEATTKASPAA